MSEARGVNTPKARIPRRFYAGNPRKLTVPEKSIKQCSMDGTHHVRPESTCSPVCAQAERDHVAMLALIGV